MGHLKTKLPRSQVAHVTFGLNVGGQEKLLVELARHTEPRSFDLRFISIGLRGELAEDVEALGWPVFALGAPSGLKPSLIVKLAAIFRRWRPDVVHTHDPRALFYAGPAARAIGAPMLVHTRHGRDVGSTPRQTVMFRWLARLVDRFVCVSGEVSRLSLQQGIDESRLHTILNGIDISRFGFHGPNASGPVVAVARLSPEKDIANLVRATAMAVERAPDLRVEVAGGGPCRERLCRLAAELGVADRVAFLGEVRDVPAVLSRARMFVLPSRSEGIPLTVLEAMACGLPVVATRVGGLPEVVEEGVTGHLVPPADPAALAAAMVETWSDPDRRDRMGHAGRRRAEQYFDIRRMVAQYEALYRDGTRRTGRSDSTMRASIATPQPGEHTAAVE